MDSVSTIENSSEVAVSVGNVLVVAGKKGDTGAEGVGVDDIYVNEVKNLIFKLTDGRQLPAGYLPAGAEGPQGIQGLPGRDGRDGDDGRGIANITLTDGQLNISMSDGSVVPLGTVKGENGINGSNGISVVGAAVQPWGNLFLFLSDGSSIDCGSVTGGSSGSGSGFVPGQISQFVKAQSFPWLACDGSLFLADWYPDLANSEFLEKVPVGSIWYMNFMASSTSNEVGWKSQLNSLLIDANSSLHFLSPASVTINILNSELSGFTQADIQIFTDPLAVPAHTSGSITGYATDCANHVFMSEKFGTFENQAIEISVTTNMSAFSRVTLAVENSDDVQPGCIHFDAESLTYYAFVGASVYSSPDALIWTLVTDTAGWGAYSNRVSKVVKAGSRLIAIVGFSVYLFDTFTKESIDAATGRYVGISAGDKAFVINDRLFLTDFSTVCEFNVPGLYKENIDMGFEFTSAKKVGNSILLANDVGDVFHTLNFSTFEEKSLDTVQNYSAAHKALQFHERQNGTLAITHGANNRGFKLYSLALNEEEKWKLPKISDVAGAKSYIKVQ